MEAFCAKGWRCSVMDHSPRRKIADAVQPYGAQAADCAAEYVVTVSALGGSKLMYHAAASAAPPAADDGRGCGPLGHDKGDGPRWAAALRWRARRPSWSTRPACCTPSAWCICRARARSSCSSSRWCAAVPRRHLAPRTRGAGASPRCRRPHRAGDLAAVGDDAHGASARSSLRTRGARGARAGQRAPLWLNALPLTAHPGLDRSDGVFKRGAAQADFVLAALRGAGLERHRPRRAAARHGRSAASAARRRRARPGEQRLVLADWKNWHYAGLQGSATGEPAPSRCGALRGFYAALRERLRADGGGAIPPAGLLMHVSEWALEATLDAVGHVLAATGVDPRPLTFAHYNHGTMRREYRLGVGGGGEAESTWAPLQRWSRSAGLGSRKPRLSEPIRQAWWSNLLWIMAVRKPSAATKKVLKVLKPCGRHPSTDAALPGGDSLPPAKFLLLGGRHRGVAASSPSRSRSVASSSTERRAGRAVATASATGARWRGRGARSRRARGAAAPPESRAPFSADEERQLLGDASPRASRVRRAAARARRGARLEGRRQGARVVVGAVARRAVRAHLRVGHGGARRRRAPLHHREVAQADGARAAVRDARLARHARRPRALGFRSFAPAINESYDEILDGAERLRAALAEAARLAEMGEEVVARARLGRRGRGGAAPRGRPHALWRAEEDDGGSRAERRRRRTGGVPPAPPPPPPPPEAGWFSGSAGGSSGGRSRGCPVIGLSSWLKPRCVGACTGEFLDQV